MKLIHLFWGAGIVWVITYIISSWYSWRYFKELKEKFPDLYADFGFPDWKTEWSYRRALPLIKYLYEKQYIDGRNRDEIIFCELHRNKIIVSYAIGVLGWVIAISMIVAMGIIWFT